MRCSNCEERATEYSTSIDQFTAEIAFLEERQVLTVERKSRLMQDWLSDQAVKNSLRCQIRALGGEPNV